LSARVFDSRSTNVAAGVARSWTVAARHVLHRSDEFACERDNRAEEPRVCEALSHGSQSARRRAMPGGLNRPHAAPADAREQARVGDPLVPGCREKEVAHRAASTNVARVSTRDGHNGAHDRLDAERWDQPTTEDAVGKRATIEDALVAYHVLQPLIWLPPHESPVQRAIDGHVTCANHVAEARPQPLGWVQHQPRSAWIELDVPRGSGNLVGCDDLRARDWLEQIRRTEAPLKMPTDPCELASRFDWVFDRGEHMRMVRHDHPRQGAGELCVEMLPEPRSILEPAQAPTRATKPRNEMNDDHCVNDIDRRPYALHVSRERFVGVVVPDVERARFRGRRTVPLAGCRRKEARRTALNSKWTVSHSSSSGRKYC